MMSLTTYLVLLFNFTAVIFAQAATYNIGDYAQGGVVFWLDPTNEHGLTAAIVDQDDGEGAVWNNGLNVYTHTTADGVYLGSQNTQTIVTIQSLSTPGDVSYAAQLAIDYSVAVEGMIYTNWYLPSAMEANLMFQNAAIINATAVANEGTALSRTQYWTSYEYNLTFAANQDFNAGNQTATGKDQLLKVRAIRAF